MNLITFNEQQLKAENLKIARSFDDNLFNDTTEDVLFPTYKMFRQDGEITEQTIIDVEEEIKDRIAGMSLVPSDFKIGSLFLTLSLLSTMFNKDNQPIQQSIVPILDDAITSEINNVVKYCGGVSVKIDSFIEDWSELHQALLHSYNIFNNIKNELEMIASRYLHVINNLTDYITIIKSNTGDVKVMTLYVPTEVVFRKTFLYQGYNHPGIFIVTPKDSRYGKLASIASETGLTIFCLFIKNPFRENGCIKVWFNKETNNFVVSI